MLRKLHLMLIALTLSMSGIAQPLFSIDGKDVSASEFRRECRDLVEVSDTFGLYSLMLDYADYRLLVHDAKTKSYDTTSQFRNAMQYYGNMLMLRHIANNSRSQAIIAKLFKNSAYQYKVWAARIDIYANSGRDSSAAYKKALRFIDRVNGGSSFENVAMQMSDSPQTKYDGGYLGWASPIDISVGDEAMDFIFNHYNDNQMSRPIHCGDAYYIVKTGGRRTAIAEVDVSPIIIRKQSRRTVNDSLKTLMESIANDLKSGKNFNDLQMRYSDIKFSERMPIEAAYRKYSTKIADIDGVGKWSDVIETSNFYCIVRLNDQTPFNADLSYRKVLDNKFFGTDFFYQSYHNYLDSVRASSGYQRVAKFDKICRLMPDSSIFEAQWNPTHLSGLEGELFTFAGKSHSLLEFAEYIRDNQYSTGYTKISEYVSHRYDEYIDMLTQQAAVGVVSNSDFFKDEMKYYAEHQYFDMHNPFRQFAKNASDSSKVYRYYKDSKLSLKSSHVLSIRFYDYLTDQNRKKVSKIAAELTTNPQYAYNASIMKAGDAGTFNKGDNVLADRVINDYDHGGHGKVFFFDDRHIFAIVDEIVKKPEELPMKDIFSAVAPAYYNNQKENYIQQLRDKYHLEIKPDAQQVLESMF